MPIKVEQNGRQGWPEATVRSSEGQDHPWEQGEERRVLLSSQLRQVLGTGNGAEHPTSVWCPHGIIRFDSQPSGLKT